MPAAQFPEPEKLDLLEIGVPDNNAGKYTLSNPHPAYGKDPNIINQLGHTVYPKWVDSKIDGKRVIVNSPMEEAQHLGEEVKQPELSKIQGWS